MANDLIGNILELRSMVMITIVLVILILIGLTIMLIIFLLQKRFIWEGASCLGLGVLLFIILGITLHKGMNVSKYLQSLQKN